MFAFHFTSLGGVTDARTNEIPNPDRTEGARHNQTSIYMHTLLKRQIAVKVSVRAFVEH